MKKEDREECPGEKLALKRVTSLIKPDQRAACLPRWGGSGSSPDSPGVQPTGLRPDLWAGGHQRAVKE